MNTASVKDKKSPWLQIIRQAALERYTQQGLPTFHHEDWKYTNVTPIAKRAYTVAPQPTNDTLSQIDLIKLIDNHSIADYPRLIFVDGYYIKNFSQLDTAINNIIITNLAEKISEDSTLLQQYFTQNNSGQNNAFTQLNTALFTDGAYIHLPTDSTLKKPLQLLFISTAQATSYTTPIRNLIIADKNSQASIIETYISLNDNNNHFTNIITEISVGENAAIEHYKLLQENKQAFHIGTLEVAQQAHSRFNSHSFAFGGALVRSDINVHLSTEYAECTLNGLYMPTGQQHIDHHTFIDHAQPHGTSHEYYKGIIADKARAVFNGKVLVRLDAQKTNAQQSNKNLLLSNDAEIDTKPQLEIFADDVQCTHGATVGQLDEDALFYLRSRGIDIDAARNMLIHSFASEMLERVPLAPLREKLQKTLEQKLNNRITEQQ